MRLAMLITRWRKCLYQFWLMFQLQGGSVQQIDSLWKRRSRLQETAAEPFDQFVHAAAHQQFGQMLPRLAIAACRQSDFLFFDSFALAQQGIEPALHQLLHTA